MTLYAESSAVLTWLLDEPDGRPVRDCLRQAQLVLSSRLTLLECERALIRRQQLGQCSPAEAADDRARLWRTFSHWTSMALTEEIMARSGQPFPHEPVRSLDALHLSSALVARSLAPEVGLLSLDRRVRENGAALGFRVVPDSTRTS